jgi:hypothetical protein
MASPNHAAADRQRVRPYAMTGGRTRPTHDALEIETLVSTTSTVDLTPKLTVEQRAIAVLCHDILSIAEVSAKLHLPLGVVRILVGDMADDHLVMVHRPAHPGDRPDLALLERVLYGSTPSDPTTSVQLRISHTRTHSRLSTPSRSPASSWRRRQHLLDRPALAAPLQQCPDPDARPLRPLGEGERLALPGERFAAVVPLHGRGIPGRPVTR